MPENTDEVLPKAWLTAEEDALVPSREYWQNSRDPISHYYRWIWEYLAYLPLLCDLRRESAVLELACGHGRAAHGLLQYLRYPGLYRGFDVDRRQVELAQELIQSLAPNFQFEWADVYSRESNPSGLERAESFVFPYEDESFDVVFAASLFTHLLPAETERYFRESRRVLRPDGKILFSLFLLDHYRGKGTAISPLYEVEHLLAPGVAVREPDFPDRLVAYSIDNVSGYAESAGLEIERILPGLWSERPGLAVNEQDLVVLVPGRRSRGRSVRGVAGSA